jgi:hypothetical protein
MFTPLELVEFTHEASNWDFCEDSHDGYENLSTLGDDMDAFIGMKARDACSTYSTDSEEMTIAIRAHPMYARLVEAYYDCKKIGAERIAGETLEREKNAMLYSIQVMNEDMSSDSTNIRDVSPQDLDAFMRECTHEIESYTKELHALVAEAESCCENFETRVRRVKSDCIRNAGRSHATRVDAATPSRAPATMEEEDMDYESSDAPSETDGSRRLTTTRQRREHEESLRQELKRKYASSILTLRSEFLKKRKIGKLPSDSTDILKNWWSDNIAWPYPSEADKLAILQQTKLNATQVNNWFINQRKRHWHKLFTQAQPSCKEEAEEALAKSFGGSLEKALAYARSL